MCIFLNQQKTLNSYKASQEYYQEEIETKLAYQETLKETKSNIDTALSTFASLILRLDTVHLCRHTSFPSSPHILLEKP